MFGLVVWSLIEVSILELAQSSLSNIVPLIVEDCTVPNTIKIVFYKGRLFRPSAKATRVRHLQGRLARECQTVTLWFGVS